MRTKILAPILSFALLTLCAFMLMPQASFADVAPLDVTIHNPISTNNFQDFVAAVLDIVLQVGIPIVALFLIYSGFLFVKARGNPTELETAKKTFIWTCVGAAVLLGAWVIANAIGATVNEIRA